MNRERLLLQRQVLLDVKARDKAFDMSSWVDLNAVGLLRTGVEDLGCGTASCAFGWLCRDPRGRALGLTFTPAGRPEYEGELDDGERFFNIPFKQARWLFIPDAYENIEDRITPDHVIERIDWLLAGKAISDFREYDDYDEIVIREPDLADAAD